MNDRPAETASSPAVTSSAWLCPAVELERPDEAGTRSGLVGAGGVSRFQTGKPISDLESDLEFPDLKSGNLPAGEGEFTGVRPYYDADGITIYHGDCREVLPFLSHVDMIWTDPPYPREYLPLYGVLAEHAARLLPNAGHCFAYCGQSYLPEVMRLLGEHLVYNWAVCCEHRGPKTNVWARGVRSTWKPILWYRRRPLTDPEIQVVDRVHSRRDKVDHEWAQGEEGGLIMEACVAPGGVILDPFMGSGTTLRVARAHGRRVIGIDVEERCCEMAVRRLAQGVLSLGGGGAEPVRAGSATEPKGHNIVLSGTPKE